MVAYARARAKSWLSLLWPEATQPPIKSETNSSSKSQKLIEQHNEQRKNFLEISKNGGMWFS